jgi:hypothetical protein
MRTGIHYAALSTPRMQRALKALEDAGLMGLTTREWIAKANICACNSVASELRRCGVNVICSYDGRRPQGSSIFRYRLAK